MSFRRGSVRVFCASVPALHVVSPHFLIRFGACLLSTPPLNSILLPRPFQGARLNMSRPARRVRVRAKRNPLRIVPHRGPERARPLLAKKALVFRRVQCRLRTTKPARTPRPVNWKTQEFFGVDLLRRRALNVGMASGTCYTIKASAPPAFAVNLRIPDIRAGRKDSKHIPFWRNLPKRRR